MRLTQRLDLIKLVTLLGMLCSVLLSYNLWAGQRWFPRVPLFDGFIPLQAPYDFIYFGLLLLFIVLAFVSQTKTWLVILILFNVFLCIDDQNRLQPWFYNYNLILLIFLFYKNRVDEPNNYTSVFISIQLLVALVYIYSGLQKLNTMFVSQTFDWMISPLSSMFSERQMGIFHKLGYAVPYVEMFTGLALLFRSLRFIAVPLIILMHVFILIMLGPLGKSYNYVVWPWNLTMIVLNLLLFSNVQEERFFDISILFRSTCFYIVITLMLIFPFFSFNNKYDSYLSSSLYSANTHDCKLILSDKAYNNLPFYIRHYVNKGTDNNVLYIKHWAIDELKVPCVPEYRIFTYLHTYIMKLTNSSEQDVKMEFTEREKILNF